MKKKYLTLALAAIFSLTGTNAFAYSTETSITVPATNKQDLSDWIQGQGKYGRATILSTDEGYAEVVQYCPNSPPTIATIGTLYFKKGDGSATNNFYMSSSCTYRLLVYSYKAQVKGYIRSYD